MSVKRVKILLTGDSKSISVPLRIDSLPMDNTDLIDTDFVSIERRKTINPIIDYEKVRATPYYYASSSDCIRCEDVYQNPSDLPPDTIYIHPDGRVFYNITTSFVRFRFSMQFCKLTSQVHPITGTEGGITGDGSDGTPNAADWTISYGQLNSSAGYYSVDFVGLQLTGLPIPSGYGVLTKLIWDPTINPFSNSQAGRPKTAINIVFLNKEMGGDGGIENTNFYLTYVDGCDPCCVEDAGGLKLIEKIVYNVYFSDGTNWQSYYGTPYLESGVFTDKDLVYRLNRFKNSFLRLRYNSTPNNTTTKLVGLQQIYTQLGDDNVYTYNKDPNNLGLTETDIKSKVGQPLPVGNNPVRLIVGDNRKIKDIEPDGFFFYWQKRHFPVDIYLSYTFNNAKNGKVTTLTPKNISGTNKIAFSEIHDVTFIPIEMKYDNGIHMFIFKPKAIHNGIFYDGNTKTLTINLYQKISK